MKNLTITRQECVEFLNILIKKIGLGFHPDNLMRHYIKADCTSTFSVGACKIYEHMLHACIYHCKVNNLDIYEMCLESEAYQDAMRAMINAE
jgi:hypothetical protein